MFWAHLEAILVLAPILGLLTVGFVIALWSGVVSVSTHQGQAFLVGNFSRLLLRLTAVVVGLLMLQHFIGIPAQLSW